MIPSSFWKDQKSGRPTCSFQAYIFAQKVWSSKYTRPFLLFLNGILLSVAYYFYLDGLYVSDIPFDIHGPRELSLQDKLTIKVLATPHVSDIQTFVLHYSICPVVDRTIVVWPNGSEQPNDELFKYTTTHGKVEFDTQSEKTPPEHFYGSSKVHTRGEQSLCVLSGVLRINRQIYA